MKKLTPVLLLAVVCFGCGQQEKKDPLKKAPKPVHARNGAPLFHYGNPVLLQYDRYLAGLDTQSVTKGGQAVDTFLLLFKNQPAAVCDTAYYIFDKFHSSLCMFLNAHMEADSINYEEIFYGKDYNGQNKALSKKQKAVKRALDKNGFSLNGEEGMAYIEQNEQYMVQHFAKYVSAPMKQFMTQLVKEQKEGFQEDAGLTISPTQLADRAVWWEKFSKANSNFLFTNEVAYTSKAMLYFLMEGMDNTSVREYRSDTLANDSLSAYYKEAWSYLQEKHPQSAANAVVAPYFNAWLKRDTAEISQTLNDYRTKYGSPWE